MLFVTFTFLKQQLFSPSGFHLFPFSICSYSDVSLLTFLPKREREGEKERERESLRCLIASTFFDCNYLMS